MKREAPYYAVGLQFFTYLFTYSPPAKFYTHSQYSIVSFLVSTRFTCLYGNREDKILNRIWESSLKI